MADQTMGVIYANKFGVACCTARDRWRWCCVNRAAGIFELPDGRTAKVVIDREHLIGLPPGTSVYLAGQHDMSDLTTFLHMHRLVLTDPLQAPAIVLKA